MLRSVRGHVRSNVVGYIALFFALGLGSAWAATELEKNEVKSKHIGKGQVKGADLATDAVTSPKVADGSLLDDDFAAGQLPAGPPGAEGPQGAPCPSSDAACRGPEGGQGAAGSPDTPAQVLAKLAGVDGPGSGLDADTVDGGNPVSGTSISAFLGESGPTANFNVVAHVPGVGQVEGDCNESGLASASADTRFNLDAGVDGRITVDAGNASAQLEELSGGAASSATNSSGFTTSTVDFQIWRVIANPPMAVATIFVQVRKFPSGSFDICEWQTSTMLWLE